MNEIFRRPVSQIPPPPGTTQAGDGLPRRKWTGEEVQRMIEAGIVEHGERFELIGGDLVAMAAKGNHHETLKSALNDFWIRARAADIRVTPETPLRLDPHCEPEPDFIVFPAGMKPGDVRGETVLLVVEIADTSLIQDHRTKAPLYAAFGVREYWVINARSRATTVYREPGPSGYGSRVELPGDALLVPLLAPSLAVRLADLDDE